MLEAFAQNFSLIPNRKAEKSEDGVDFDSTR